MTKSCDIKWGCLKIANKFLVSSSHPPNTCPQGKWSKHQAKLVKTNPSMLINIAAPRQVEDPYWTDMHSVSKVKDQFTNGTNWTEIN